jgi:hypothetical protein
MAVTERSLSYQDALKEGLAIVPPSSKYNELKGRYYKQLGGGSFAAGQAIIANNQIMPEEFWTSTYNAFSKNLKYFPKTSTAALQKQTASIQERTGREVGSQRATTLRAARAASGMLSGAKSPAMGASGSGPMLGGDSMLGEESMLGSKRRV